MASSPITSWKINEEKAITVTAFILGGCKITVDGDCSHEIKRQLLLGRKAMSNLDIILKRRDITLLTKVRITMVFPTVLYGCKSWTIKKAEHWRINAFEQWCWRRLLRVPCTARWSNQSILMEINPEYSLKRLMLKLQYFSHLMWELTHWKDPDAGKDWRQEEKGTTDDEMVGWHHQLNGYGFEQALRDSERQGCLVCWSPVVAKSQTRLSEYIKAIYSHLSS